MMEKVTLSGTEQKRLFILYEVLAGRTTGKVAAEVLRLNLLDTRRLIVAYRRNGASALPPGNRGRRPVNKLDKAVAQEIVRLAQDPYLDHNDRHFTEELAKRHGIAVSCPTVRRLRREAGLGTPSKRRSPRHRQRRQRYPQSGMLL